MSEIYLKFIWNDEGGAGPDVLYARVCFDFGAEGDES